MTGKFNLIPEKNMNFFNYSLLRIIEYTLGRSERIGIFIKNILRDFLITKKSNSIGAYRRTFLFEEKSINIVDELQNVKGFKGLYVSPKSSYVYIPSSRYFNPKEIELDVTKNITNVKRRVVVSRKFNYDGKLIK